MSDTEKQRSRLAIYTCITNGYDDLKEPRVHSDDCDYICFTDQMGCDRFRSNIWRFKLLDGEDLSPALQSRLPKILPHRYLPDYDISVWLDGSFMIHGDLAGAARQFLRRADMALFRHAEKRASVRAEAAECRRLGKGDPDAIRRQVAAYLRDGFPDETPLPENGIMFRRHGEKKVTDAMEIWWEQLRRHSHRDQLSLLYAVWKAGFGFDMYQKKALKPFVRHLPHAASRPNAGVREPRFLRRLKLKFRQVLVLNFPALYKD